MSFSDPVICDNCKRKEIRGNTLIIENPKGRFRLCRECFALYESGQLNENYKRLKSDPKVQSIKGLDPYGLIKKQEDFIKNIKEGALRGNKRI